MERGWFLRRRADRLYILREATALPIGLYAIHLALGLVQLARGSGPFASWQRVNDHPGAVLFAVLVLAAALVHSATWFAITPKVLPRFVAGRALSAPAIESGLWWAMAVASLGFVALAVWA